MGHERWCAYGGDKSSRDRVRFLHGPLWVVGVLLVVSSVTHHPYSMTKALGVPDENYAAVERYVVAKALRYNQPTVLLADNMLYGFSKEQLLRLRTALAAKGYVLKVKNYNFGLGLTSDAEVIANDNKVPRFGEPGRVERELLRSKMRKKRYRDKHK